MPRAVKHCAVVGAPIAHSRSPVLHRAAYAALGLTDWSYDRLELQPERLRGWLSGLDASWRGISVTMPLKQTALSCAASASTLAATLGAANTLVRTQRGWHADNTDVAGLLGALAERDVDRAGRDSSATVIGAGGTAAAAVAALSALGFEHVGVVVRAPTRAQALLDVVARLGLTSRTYPWPDTSGDWTAGQGLDADLVLSTVPAAATTALLDHEWRVGQTVVDVSYEPWPTKLVESATARGAQGIGGAPVLLWQAVRQVELMTGRPAPVEAMREALLPGGNLVPG
ncbi:MAG: shikimate dehydrogenase [Geodermatophilaceae bacterium]|nr:shikimate dehydrogenase [Geodermatophilaceae bacterium]